MVYRELVGRIIDLAKVNSSVSATVRLNNLKKLLYLALNHYTT